ncbi:hypothetical protein [Rhizobium rhizogenes]|uniref:hypothetical protein n=1 Tax=Rhizobium rhizogenes TaxID=359 RepID=UPI001573A948|nr:hypothetical protein [Rhizobium rhizogenes]NTG94213.1 hypothetical protein [Rhizobium rhizogenes]
MAKLSPYTRIALAAKKGVGVRLSPDEVWDMAHDDAIATVAENIRDGVYDEDGKFIANDRATLRTTEEQEGRTK